MMYEECSENRIYELYLHKSENYNNHLTEVYMRFLKNLLINNSIIKSELSDSIEEQIDLGKKTYNYCLNVINNKIYSIEKGKLI
ncbi:MAG: hypothetical protein EU549_03200 [Promethearchaeota archaeon]|nr:MAG: hypothetical protein EU549_03200 [Candidatus Lokiarchaeota archaeon]